MHGDEVKSFLREHTKRYPALTSWMRGNDGQLDIWREQLAHVHVDDAIEASRRLYERSDQPRGYSRHPAIIREIAGEIAAERTSQRMVGEPAHCGRCADSGWVSVIAPETLTALHWAAQGVAASPDANPITDGRRGKAMTILQRRALRWCAMVCDCERGDVITRATRNRQIARYAPGSMLITHSECVQRALVEQIDLWDAAAELLVERATELSPQMVSVDDWEG